MGVKDLWQILDDKGIAQKVPLSYLRGKRVAVDLSGWVVQSNQCPGLNQSRKPHLKNLFHKVSHLLANGTLPVFIIDGRPPDMKGNTIKKRLKQPHEGSDDARLVTRIRLDQGSSECQEMLESLGVPCIKSDGEAESLCAFLNAKGIVDGCITQDSDAFAYGATTVFRDFTVSPPDPHMKVYNLSDIEEKLGLNQEKFIALALLLGCDYDDGGGVQGIGKETALKLFKEMKSTSTLQRFKEWKEMSPSVLFPEYDPELDKENPSHCTRCGHPGGSTLHKLNGCPLCGSEITCYMMKSGESCSCNWHQNAEAKDKIKIELKVYRIAKDMPGFPDHEVIDEYLKSHHRIPEDKELNWMMPDLSCFEEKAFNWLGWTAEACSKKTLPIFTSWQITQLLRGEANSVDFLYEPVRIIKKQEKYGNEYYKVYWKCKDGDDVVNDITLPTTFDKDKCTLEDITCFSKVYPHVLDEFLNSIEEKKCTQKKKKSKSSPSKKKIVSARNLADSPSKLRKVNSVEIITLSPLPSPPILETSENIYGSEKNLISTPKTEIELSDKVLLNFSVLESDDSFIDMPLTQRLQMNSLIFHKRNKPVISILSTQEALPLSVSVQSPEIGNVESQKSGSSSQGLGIFKPEIELHTPNTAARLCSYFNTSSASAERGCTPHRKLIYSVQKNHAEISFEISSDNLCKSNFNADAENSSANYQNFISRFEHLQVSTPGSLQNEYDASEELFTSPPLSTYENCDDSVICLN